MKNADLPAMPITEEPFAVGAVSERYGPLMFGLTKREMFAMHSMQGILSHPDVKPSIGVGAELFESYVAEMSVKMADALLSALDRKEVI